eukprot:3581509-Pyramimonas_sp.AAC.1
MQVISHASERTLLHFGNTPTLLAGRGPSNRTGLWRGTQNCVSERCRAWGFAGGCHCSLGRHCSIVA